MLGTMLYNIKYYNKKYKSNLTKNLGVVFIINYTLYNGLEFLVYTKLIK